MKKLMVALLSGSMMLAMVGAYADDNMSQGAMQKSDATGQMSHDSMKKDMIKKKKKMSHDSMMKKDAMGKSTMSQDTMDKDTMKKDTMGQ